jgi:hypothetical protein
MSGWKRLGIVLSVLWAVGCPNGTLVSHKTGNEMQHGLTEDERYAVADHVVEQLKEHGDLDEQAKSRAAPIT